MTRTYLKESNRTSATDASDVTATVQKILSDIEVGGDSVALEYAEKFDKYDGNIMLTQEEIDAACELVPEKVKDDIRFAHDNVRRFAEQQKKTIGDIQYEIVPGLVAGQRAIPVSAAGCYILVVVTVISPAR